MEWNSMPFSGTRQRENCAFEFPILAPNDPAL